MKYYPKKHEDISKRPSEKVISRMGSSIGSLDELTIRFRDFYKEVHPILFDFIVKQVWLEQKFLYNGVRRSGRSKNGYTIDGIYSFFMHGIVGISQKPLTGGLHFVAIPTYFNDFFPNFSDHDPFEESEYFKYPYEYITLDHLAFVYQVHNRMELLEEAERRSMNIFDFRNWATNQVFVYADGQPSCVYKRRGDESIVPCYMMFRDSNYIPYIRNMRK